MRYLIYKSTNLLDSILLDDHEECVYIRITDNDLKSKIFNRLILYARIHKLFFPFLLKIIHGFSKLRKITADDIVIVFDIADITLIEYIHKCIPKTNRFNVFFWNPMSKTFEDPQKAIQRLCKIGCHISTFDKKDSEMYHLIYKNQFIKKICISNLPTKFDFYFLGAPKGREDTLHSIIQRLKEIGKVGICIVPHSKEQYIPYERNLQYVLQSFCIIEIVQEGQEGVTLRALEALVYGKKLITTLRNIVNYDFYNPNNILIWNNQTNDELTSFLNTNYTMIDQKIIDKYCFHNWIQSYSK